MPHKRLSQFQQDLLEQNLLHGSDGSYLQSQRSLEERKKKVISNLKALQKEINKELKGTGSN